MELGYCYEHGLPHSEFLSWSAEDRAKTIAFAMELSEKCSMCGTAQWEWDENKFAYTPVEEFCQGCYKKSVFSDQNGKALPGTNVKLIPTTPYLSAKMSVTAKKRAKKLTED